MTRTADFEYALPEAAIAQEAIEPRDAARLLDAGSLTDLRFTDLPALLDPGDLVVVNTTRVRAARLAGTKKSTGGAVEVLLIRRIEGDIWEALVRPARRLRKGAHVEFGDLSGRMVSDVVDGVAQLRLESQDGDVEDVLPMVGTVPLPPYFHGALADPERYQTMFAKEVGSSAAPTAGLHFTPRVVAALTSRGVDVAGVELDVGLDTFRPISEPDVDDHVIHRERFFVPGATAEAVAAAHERGRRVVAVGTTVVRTLESATEGEGEVTSGAGEASLFIRPGYEFAVVDALVTNFHAPGTTLTVMIAAILGERWRSVYAAALERGYRFLSFGDAMFLDGLRSS